MIHDLRGDEKLKLMFVMSNSKVVGKGSVAKGMKDSMLCHEHGAALRPAWAAGRNAMRFGDGKWYRYIDTWIVIKGRYYIFYILYFINIKVVGVFLL